MIPQIEGLEKRWMPSTASFSNGVLAILGDNLGNAVNVQANTAGVVSVTERGQAVTITQANTGAPAVVTTANLKLVTELAGVGVNNTLATDASLGAGVAASFVGAGSGVMRFLPGANAPAFAVGASGRHVLNDFASNPGGKDTFIGGAGGAVNLFDWEPGTGSDTYVGVGNRNIVLVVGNNNGLAEMDSLNPDGAGGVTYNRNNLTPFQINTSDIQTWDIRPSTAAGNTLTVGDLSGTSIRRVEFDANSGTLDLSANEDARLKAFVIGPGNVVIPDEDAGRVKMDADESAYPATGTQAGFGPAGTLPTFTPGLVNGWNIFRAPI